VAQRSHAGDDQHGPMELRDVLPNHHRRTLEEGV
jgi:hypothetical protein